MTTLSWWCRPMGSQRARGWSAVEAWAKGLATLYTQLEVKPSDPHVHINGGVAWVVRTEHVNFKQANGQQHDLTITATNIFEKTGDRSHDSPHFRSAQILRRFAEIPYQIGGFRG